jgi:hypothetical protein
LLAFLAVAIRQEVLLVVIGGIFVMEAMSVVLQVGYFKWTGGKRIFRCSPIHHHFHLGGLSELQVVTRFWIVAVILECWRWCRSSCAEPRSKCPFVIRARHIGNRRFGSFPPNKARRHGGTELHGGVHWGRVIQRQFARPNADLRATPKLRGSGLGLKRTDAHEWSVIAS